ncbi:CU044_5270 family protein [Streptomyces hydrogenans]|uniref:CU044_5270 family protein n=1 Tax=Streptomyces hydrogenans TaxID=1873719 RepID=UPI00167ECFA5|nr:CU044_5270 family protein [Streptomyces hydrogenans]GHF93373.1 hypothetical protein GCM10018784_00940 [Streptomyces hydrogenans]
MEGEPNQRIRAGDRDAFAELFAELFDGHARGVHAYAVRLTGDWALAEDIMSLTFLEAWKQRKKLGDEVGDVRAWLLGVATNVARNTARAARRHRDEELDEVRREVPDFPVPRLGEERRLERRRHLLGRERARRPVPRRRYAVVLGAAAAVCARVAGSVVLTRQTVPGPPPATAAAVSFLERAALAAAAEPPEPARADQYVYVRVVGHTTVLSENADGGMDRTLQREDGESWTPVDGSRPTFRREDGAGEPVEEGVGERDPADPGGPGAGSFASPTYAFAAALPSDPDALLTMLLADALRHHGPGSGSTAGPAQQAFVAVGDLLRGAFTPRRRRPRSSGRRPASPAWSSSPPPSTRRGAAGWPWPASTTASAPSGSSTPRRPATSASARSSPRRAPGAGAGPSSRPWRSSGTGSSTRPVGSRGPWRAGRQAGAADLRCPS